MLVWKISEQDEKNLDRYEGFPRFYNKKNLKVAVTSLDGEDLGEVSAMVYIMTPEAVEARKVKPLPSEHYFSILVNGYEEFGFDIKILEKSFGEALGITLMPDC